MAGKNAQAVKREWAALASGDAKAVEELMLPLDGPALAAGPYRYLKILLTGELASKQLDRRVLIRPDSISNSYRSFAVMDGDAATGEWDTTGFYAGRTGWGLDADISLEYTLVFGLANRVSGYGSGTFALRNNYLLGYFGHGFLVSGNNVAGIAVSFSGGTFTGTYRSFWV